MRAGRRTALVAWCTEQPRSERIYDMGYEAGARAERARIHRLADEIRERYGYDDDDDSRGWVP